MRSGSYLLAGVVLACAGESSDHADSYAIADSAGIEIVESYSPAWREGTRRIDPEPGLQWVETDIIAMSAADGSTRAIGRLPRREPGRRTGLIPERFATLDVRAGARVWSCGCLAKPPLVQRPFAHHICCVTSRYPDWEAPLAAERPYKARRTRSPPRDFTIVADQLDRLAKWSKTMNSEDRERHARPVARMLRETATIARHVSGTIPWAWSYYLSARRAFGSDAALATALGVNRSRIARWKQGERPDPVNEARLRDLDIVVSLLHGYLEEEAIADWLHGFNPHLSNRRPIDVLRSGRLSELVRAIEAERSGAFA